MKPIWNRLAGLGLALGLGAAIGAAPAHAEDIATNKNPLSFGTGQVIIDLNKLEWAPLELEGFAPGAEFALLRGDMAHGAEVIGRVPPGYLIPSHNHTSDETIVWLKGQFTYINGEDGRAIDVDELGFASLPGNSTPHAVRCGKDPCMFYLRFSRGFDHKIFPMPEKITKLNQATN